VALRLLALECRTLPSTLTVTNLADAGDGSLRGQLAAAAPGDTVAFAPELQGTIALGSTLTLGRDVTVAGNLDAAGSPLVTLSRGGADQSTDLLVGAGVTASVGGLGLTGATLHALVNQGSLTLDHFTVSGNHIGFYANHFPSDFSGTIYNTGTLTVQDSTISNNQINGFYADVTTGGAGIWSAGTLTVLRTRLINNLVLVPGGYALPGSTYGGGISIYGGTATVTDSTLTGNQAFFGGGLFSQGAGTLTVSGCTISGNSAAAGGGLYASGMTQVTGCTITNNTALDVGGGMEFNAGPTRILTLSGSTLAGNQVGGSFYSGRGGGLHVGLNVRTVMVTNCTIANNSAVGYVYQGQLYPGAGGGLYVSATGLSAGQTLTVVGSTVAGNRTDGAGGGLWVGATRTQATVTSTLVAGNTAATAGPDVSGPLLSTSAYNLIGDGSGASGLTDGVNGNQVGTAASPIDPLLGPLQDNGGPTPTMALLPGSPALNAGDPAQLDVADQRGVVRSGGVNIGAFQASASSFILTPPDTAQARVAFDVTVTAVDSFGQVAYGYTGTVTFSTSDPDPGVVLPTDYTFTADDQGTVTFSGGVTLVTPGDQTLCATDTADATITGDATVTVDSGDAPGMARDHSPSESASPAALVSHRVQPFLEAAALDWWSAAPQPLRKQEGPSKAEVWALDLVGS
jgi:hypothetical protein